MASPFFASIRCNVISVTADSIICEFEVGTENEQVLPVPFGALERSSFERVLDESYLDDGDNRDVGIAIWWLEKMDITYNPDSQDLPGSTEPATKTNG